MVRKWGPYAVAVLWVYLLVWPHVASLSNWNTNIWPLADHTSTVMWVLKEGYTELWSATVERALAAGVTPPTTAGLAKLEIYPSFSAIYEIDSVLTSLPSCYVNTGAIDGTITEHIQKHTNLPFYTFSSCWAQAGNTNVLGDDYAWPQREGLDARRRALNLLKWTCPTTVWSSRWPTNAGAYLLVCDGTGATSRVYSYEYCIGSGHEEADWHGAGGDVYGELPIVFEEYDYDYSYTSTSWWDSGVMQTGTLEWDLDGTNNWTNGKPYWHIEHQDVYSLATTYTNYSRKTKYELTITPEPGEGYWPIEWLTVKNTTSVFERSAGVLGAGAEFDWALESAHGATNLATGISATASIYVELLDGTTTNSECGGTAFLSLATGVQFIGTGTKSADDSAFWYKANLIGALPGNSNVVDCPIASQSSKVDVVYGSTNTVDGFPNDDFTRSVTMGLGAENATELYEEIQNYETEWYHRPANWSVGRDVIVLDWSFTYTE